MSVICALPVQVPVHRMRVTVRCRELGTVVHTAVRRLIESGLKDDEHIAAVLGLPWRRIKEVRGELDHRLALTEREYLMWVDHARGRCLPYSALADDECAVRGKDAGLTLPVDPPTCVTLARMGLNAAASWDAGVSEGHVEIDEVLEVIADRRGRAPSGHHPLSHVLRLPDVQLLVSEEGSAAGSPRLSLAQHGIENEQLTRWLHEKYGERLESEIVDLEAIKTATLTLTPALPPAPDWLAEFGEASGWAQLEPAPQVLREHIADVADAAQDRLVVYAPDFGGLPAWLRNAMDRAREREVQVLLCCDNARNVPKGSVFREVTEFAEHTGALIVIADVSRAVVHSDARACLEQGTSRVERHFLTATDVEPAVQGLLELLGLDPPVRLTASQKLGPDTIKQMLEDALSQLRSELPEGVDAAIGPDDERFAAETLDRYTFRGEKPTQTMLSAAAGTAWECVLIAATKSLADDDAKLEFVAARWVPADARVDLDVIVRDHRKRIVWILDAKNAAPNHEQSGGMLFQQRIASRDPAIAAEGWDILGLIVHPSRKLPGVSPRQTEQREVVRCTLQDLPDLLLSATLPDQRVGGAR